MKHFSTLFKCDVGKLHSKFEGFTLKSVHSIRTRGRVILPPKMIFELQSHDAA